MDKQHHVRKKGEVSASGRVIYLSNCTNCHGADREGVSDAFPSLIGLKERQQREDTKQIISNGKGQMPAYPQFDDEQLKWHGGAFDPEINVQYVNANEMASINQLAPLEPDDVMTDQTPLQRGRRIYNENCTACHGLNKQGNPPHFPH